MLGARGGAEQVLILWRVDLAAAGVLSMLSAWLSWLAGHIEFNHEPFHARTSL